MTPRSVATPAAVALALLLAGCAPAATGVQVRDAWVRASPAAATMGAAYLTLSSDRDDRLIAVSVPDTIAARAELHVTTHEPAGQMGMQQVPWIALPSRRTVTFAPGSMHVMLIDLRHPLRAQETVALRLRFERAPAVTVMATVRAD